MLNTINLHYCDRRVLVVCHQVVVLCFRYILEELDEQQILAIDRQAEVLNCGICAYEFDRRGGPVRARARRCGTTARRWKRGRAQDLRPRRMAGTR